mgnify:CR=1 FL=1
MKKIFFVFLVFLFLFGCGKKSAPVYKSENQINNIIIIS